MKNDLRAFVPNEEIILYEGRPHKRSFMIDKIISKRPIFVLIIYMFFAVLFFLFTPDLIIFRIILESIITIIFCLYITKVVLSDAIYENTYYIITDKKIYFATGDLSKKVYRRTYIEVNQVYIRRGIFDRKYGVGDVIIVFEHSYKLEKYKFENIKEYIEVYKIIKKHELEADKEYIEKR